MRIRHKAYAYPELCSWEYFVKDPPSLRGKWHRLFGNDKPLVLELGCGKGTFAAGYSAKRHDVNLLAVDIKSEILVLAKHKIESGIADGQIAAGSVYIMSQDIMRISLMLSPEDTVDTIYINFPNPWPKESHKKRRLTHPKQLMQYKEFLKPGGSINFKTDDDELFTETLEYFKECGFEIERATNDIYSEPLPKDYVVTEHESQFLEQGLKIKYIKAVLKG